jgi:hypothetical protein
MLRRGRDDDATLLPPRANLRRAGGTFLFDLPTVGVEDVLPTDPVGDPELRMRFSA